jgi:hypothetical protein
LLTALACVAVAQGGGTQVKPTSVAVDGASASPEGVVDVTGSLDSPAGICRTFRSVELVLRRPDGKVRTLDEGFASFRSHVWRLRSRRGVADDGTFFVEVDRQRIEIIKIGPNGKEKHRRIVCARARAPVQLPE